MKKSKHKVAPHEVYIQNILAKEKRQRNIGALIFLLCLFATGSTYFIFINRDSNQKVVYQYYQEEELSLSAIQELFSKDANLQIIIYGKENEYADTISSLEAYQELYENRYSIQHEPAFNEPQMENHEFESALNEGVETIVEARIIPKKRLESSVWDEIIQRRKEINVLKESETTLGEKTHIQDNSSTNNPKTISRDTTSVKGEDPKTTLPQNGRSDQPLAKKEKSATASTKDKLAQREEGVLLNQSEVGMIDEPKSVESSGSTVIAPLIAAEKMPSFPGGEGAMYNYLNNRIKYPRQARDYEIEGKVYVQFVVDQKGKLNNPKVVKGIGYGCDQEAIRIVKLMPQWEAGKQNQQNVPVIYTLPITFRLN